MSSDAKLYGIVIASSLALTVGSALAQSSTSPSQSPSFSDTASQRASLPNPLAMEDVGQIVGKAVYGGDDSKIGTISAVLMNPQTKTLNRLVVRQGGVLGIGGHDVALPISAFLWDRDLGDFTIAQTADDLKNMTEWQRPEVAEAPDSHALARTGDAPAAPIAPPTGDQ